MEILILIGFFVIIAVIHDIVEVIFESIVKKEFVPSCCAMVDIGFIFISIMVFQYVVNNMPR